MNIAAVAVNINDTSIVYSGSRDYGVKGWEIETGKMIAQFSAPRNIVTTMEYASGNASSLLFQGSEDLCVRAWDTKSSSSQPALHITGYVYFPTSMAVHPGLFVCLFVCLFFFVSLCVTSTHHSVNCFNTPLDGKYLATGSKGFNSVGCEVKIWDLRKTSAPFAELKGHSHDVVGVKYSEGGSSGARGSSSPGVPGGLKLISTSKDGSIFVWDATNER